MQHVFQVSDEQYAKLAAYAARHKQTPESLFQSWVKAVTQNAEKSPSTSNVSNRNSTNAENKGLTEAEKNLLNSPLFQIEGMFAIGEEGWADRHDEYLGEIYLENHADTE